MASFFKNFGKGILYVLAFPFILAGIAIYGVFGILVFVYQFIKLIFLFFTGRTLFTDLDEDVKAKAILYPQNTTSGNDDNGGNVTPVTSQTQTNQQDNYGDYQIYTSGSFVNTANPIEKEPEEVTEDNIDD